MTTEAKKARVIRPTEGVLYVAKPDYPPPPPPPPPPHPGRAATPVSFYPQLRIRVPDGRTVLTTVELDGRRLPVTRVQFDTGESLDGVVAVTVTFLADIEVEVDGTAPVVTAIGASR